MTLIKSISGIRGTIGGITGDNLTPVDIVKFTSAFAHIIKKESKSKSKIAVGRDARVSGEMVNNIVVNTLIAMGVDVVDLGLSTTPTVEMAVVDLNCDGGIIITASHNPGQWNALKLLNCYGEFIDDNLGKELLEIADSNVISFAEINELGKIVYDNTQIEKHIDKIKALPYVDVSAIANAKFKVVIDAVNSTGGIAIPMLLKSLGVEDIIELYCEPTGVFPHNPEPLPENLTIISDTVKDKGADIGFVVDPDVDRLAIVDENGNMFGEEYTLVAVADFILSKRKGNTVSNMSSTMALRDVTESYGMNYFASAVGEVNVVKKMKEVKAIVGGEGNGGVILPELHYGRDALVGIALFLTHLATSGKSCSQLRASYPNYHISKNKIELEQGVNVDEILELIANKYNDKKVSREDGVRITMDKQWIHLRKSNTEPIIRIYSESSSYEESQLLAKGIIDDINAMLSIKAHSS